jgi:hypothetical protein
MRPLSQADCLALWESGQTLHPLDRGLLAVHAAFPESRSESVADWPIGRRNRALAELRCACFGRWIRGWTACEQCNDKLEFEVDGDALAESAVPSEPAPVEVQGRKFRLPTSRDLAKIAGVHDPSTAAMQLLDQCLVAKAPASSPNWSEEYLDQIGETMAAADPLAEITLHFDCPACSHSFDQSLDLISFFWSEMEGRAKRLMLDVHTLASVYGWSESEILALSPARRDFYLEMVRA